MTATLLYSEGRVVEVRAVQRINVREHWHRVNNDVTMLEDKHWIPTLEKLFIVVGAKMAGRLAGSGRRWSKREKRDADSDSMMHQIYDKKALMADIEEATQPLYGLTFNVALAGTGRAFGAAFDLGPPEAVNRLVLARANKLAGPVADTVYDDVKRQLVKGLAEGESIPKLADRVRGYMAETSKFRATRIARTEAISAYNGAVRDAGDLYGDVVVGYQWVSTKDARTRPDHAEASGQKIPKDGLFKIGGEELRHPGDPDASPANIVNCRCTMIPLLDEDDLPKPGAPPVANVPTLMGQDEFTELLDSMPYDEDYDAVGTQYTKQVKEGLGQLLDDYIGQTYYDINKGLRTGHFEEARFKQSAQDIAAAMDKHGIPIPHDTVYRGVRDDVFGSDLLPGDELADKAFVSVSQNANIAINNFSDYDALTDDLSDTHNTVFIIKKTAATANTRVLAGMVAEQEWILPPNSKFVVRSVARYVTEEGGIQSVVNMDWIA